MKQYNRWLCFIFLLFASTHLLAQETQKGLLWQINLPETQPSYLFGTIHSEDPRVLKLPREVKTCFEQSEHFIFEISMDLMTTLEASGAMLFTDGQVLEKYLDKRTFKRVAKILTQREIPLSMIKVMKPWAVIVLLSMPPSETGVFLDLSLYQKANRLKKPVYGLETVQEQVQVFEAFSMEEQVALIEETLRQFELFPEFFDKIHELYLSRDLDALLAFTNNSIQNDDKQTEKLMKTFVERLLDQRNLRMLERMQSYLQRGKAFIAVGALHLPGENGLLNLLKKQGYQVKVVY